MRHLLLCGGVQGNPRSLIHLRQVAMYQCPDGLLFVGSVRMKFVNSTDLGYEGGE